MWDWGINSYSRKFTYFTQHTYPQLLQITLQPFHKQSPKPRQIFSWLNSRLSHNVYIPHLLFSWAVPHETQTYHLYLQIHFYPIISMITCFSKFLLSGSDCPSNISSKTWLDSLASLLPSSLWKPKAAFFPPYSRHLGSSVSSKDIIPQIHPILRLITCWT